ncbi:Lrp/AsnC family transcriptional regulator [Winslowiella iniecta]|uniref:AsnC family transcriptional regulator n=1 Tax=Winslowiella iniecta TaxID=1560201 RepID=A0A0L7T482_9GAMM|nr:Lrp/AsnC family transcriptional regulator [Winslowiella iniecta]KOC87852.1 AsnC family transcriptional regulator [Winslowiella iniecta]KOC90219.1 AsnC family transcriptional regulator [Winslowiella iniecta]
MTSIDDFDLKILTLLQKNGRLTNQELSDLVGLSASQCSRRRINLEQANLILGYHARLSPDAVGLGMIGLIEVRLINHTAEYVESFHRMVAEQTSIVDAYKTTGDADYLLKVAVSDLAGLSALISQLVAGHQSVSHVKTSVVLNRLKENGLMMLPDSKVRQNGA